MAAPCTVNDSFTCAQGGLESATARARRISVVFHQQRGVSRTAAVQTSSNHRRRTRFVHHDEGAIPYVSDILKALAARWLAQMLGLSIRSDAISWTPSTWREAAWGRPLMMADASKMREQVNRGDWLADVLLACTCLPPVTKRMLSARQGATELPKSCKKEAIKCIARAQSEEALR